MFLFGMTLAEAMNEYLVHFSCVANTELIRDFWKNIYCHKGARYSELDKHFFNDLPVASCSG